MSSQGSSRRQLSAESSQKSSDLEDPPPPHQQQHLRSSFSLRIPSSSSLRSTKKSPVTFAARSSSELQPGFRSTRSFDQPKDDDGGRRPYTRSKSLNETNKESSSSGSKEIVRSDQETQQQQQQPPEEEGVWASLKAKCSGSNCESGSWSFLLSLHQLVMMSNLQSLIFGSAAGTSRPSLQPNEYMDRVLEQMKESMKERGLQEMTLPDQDVGGVVVLYDGHLSGLTNLTRRGDALLEAETDHLLLTFAVQAKDLRCAYWWRKRRLKGEVCAVVQRIIINVRLKQRMPAKSPPQLIDFKVDEVTGVQVLLHGLGPLNWLARRALRAFLRRHLREYLEKEGKDLLAQELKNMPAAIEEQSYLSFLSGQ